MTDEKKDDECFRYNHGKPEMFYWLLWPKSAEAVARVQTQGAEKYSEFNYTKATEEGTPPKDFLSSAMRHLTKASRYLITRNPDDLYDEESQNLHIAHAVWNLMMLMDFIWDRYPATKPEYDENYNPGKLGVIMFQHEEAETVEVCEHEWCLPTQATDENGNATMLIRCSLCTDTIEIPKNQ